MMDATQLIATPAVGIILTYLTEFLKEKLGVNGNASMAILAVLCSIVYAVYTLYLPDATKDQIVLFVGTAAAASHMFYQIVVKTLKKKN